MKWLLMIVTATMLTGCLGNISKDGLISTLSSASVGVLGTAVGGPIVGVVAGVVAGVVSDAATEPAGADLTVIPEADRADVLKHQQVWMALEHLGVWIIGVGAFVIFILPLIAGYLIPNGKQRRNHKEMIRMKEVLFDNPNVKMQDFKE